MKKNNKGFSLVELIVSLLVISIILGFATSFIFTGENLFRNTVQSDTQKAIGDNTLDYLVKSVRYAHEIEILPADEFSSAKFERAIFLSDTNHIGFKSGEDIDDNVFGEYFYQTNTVLYSAKVLSTNCIEIKVSVIDKDGEQKYTASNVVKLLNLHINDKVVEVEKNLEGVEIQNAVISFEK